MELAKNFGAMGLLSRYFYFKPKELRAILENFNSWEEILSFPKKRFIEAGVRDGRMLDNFLSVRGTDLAQKLNLAMQKEEIGIISFFDELYPKRLLDCLPDAPPILFYKGNLSCFTEKSLAVIGSRKMSIYGKRVLENFMPSLAARFVIVSGLAYGVDGMSHKLAVEYGGKAIAVIGSGLDVKNIYPKENCRLAEVIVKSGGLLLSEVPFGISAQKFHFPMRNRVIAGLSDAVLIIEGSRKSGTIITAKFALECGADIFAVPGGIFEPNSEGVNFLIKNGANPALCPEDVLEFYGFREHRALYEPKTVSQKKIFTSLSVGAKFVDELSADCALSIFDIMSAISEMELLGVIKLGADGKYFLVC